jgi:hypothetical protein
MAAISLVESTVNTESFDLSVFDQPRRLHAFKDVLQRALQEKPGKLAQSHSTAQLIALAFEGKTHLDLARYHGISSQTILAALEWPSLPK